MNVAHRAPAANVVGPLTIVLPEAGVRVSVVTVCEQVIVKSWPLVSPAVVGKAIVRAARVPAGVRIRTDVVAFTVTVLPVAGEAV